MKRYEFHSALPPEEIMARLRKRTRPWSRLDGWTARNTWFLREGGEGPPRLICTGPARSYGFAGLTLTPAEGGTDITALVGAAKTMYIADIVLAVMLAGMALIRVYLTGSLLGALGVLVRYGWIAPVMAWTGSLTRRKLPELVSFIGDNLLA